MEKQEEALYRLKVANEKAGSLLFTHLNKIVLILKVVSNAYLEKDGK